MYFLLVSNFENRILELTIFANESPGRFLTLSLLCLSITCAPTNASLCSYDDPRESKVAFTLGIPLVQNGRLYTSEAESRDFGLAVAPR
jgi:hypothetical protein